MAIVLTLVASPLLLTVDPRLAAASLLLAIVQLYRKRVRNAQRRVKEQRQNPQPSWNDPWNVNGIER